MLVGRARELDRLGRLVAEAATGRPEVLLLVGEPGIGKTTLVSAVADRARQEGFQVAVATAVEVEAATPGALLEILLTQLGEPTTPLPPRASRSLLHAITSAAADRPLLIVLDDVQWADALTLGALSFAARRLLADPVLMVLAGRPESMDLPWLSGFEHLELDPLSDDEAVTLLQHAVPGIDTSVARSVAHSLGGLPLALVEAPPLLGADVLSGIAPLPTPVPVGRGVQERYARGLRTLTDATLTAVAILASDDSQDAGAVADAFDVCGVSAADLEPAEVVGLVRLGSSPTFVHPLVRAAVQAAAGPTRRRQAHRALAAAHGSRGDVGRALRHRVGAATGPDDDLAADLETEARRLAAADARADAAPLAELAAATTQRHEHRPRRLTLAAELTSDPQRARVLVDRVLVSTQDPELRARCILTRAELDGGYTPEGLEAAVATVDRHALPADLGTRLDVARIWRSIELGETQRLDSLAEELSAATHQLPWLLASTLGIAYTFIGRHDRAVPLLLQAQASTADLDPAAVDLPDLWSWAVIPGWLGLDAAEHRRRIGLMAARFRGTGDPQLIVSAAFFTAERARRDGQWWAAEALYAEAIDLGTALQQPVPVEQARLASLAAYRGEATRTQSLLEESRRGFEMHEPDNWNRLLVDQARGALALTLGRPGEALLPLETVAGAPYLGRGSRDSVACALVDLVEARSLLGDTTGTRAAADELAARLDGVAEPHGRALVERCLALSRPDRADEAFAAAIALHDQTDEPFEAARTQLLSGEHLRRTRRARDARPLLASALAEFERLGALPWSARARRELEASGQQPPMAPARPAGGLTPQELRVAMAVVDGMSNAEAAAALFLSVKTVEFHLSRVYRKLGVRSRGGLARAMERSTGVT